MHLEPWQLFWAKTNRDGVLGNEPAAVHPLWAHLLDVASAAQATAARLPAPVLDALARPLGLASAEKAVPLLALLLGLHDAGKATPGFFFQPSAEASVVALRARGFSLPRPAAEHPLHHGFASIWIVRAWLRRQPWAAGAAGPLGMLATLAGFHHGRIWPQGNWHLPHPAHGPDAWRAAQGDLLDAVADAWWARHGGPPDLTGAPADARIGPEAALAFAGWATLADWVGSMATHMPRANAGDPLADYIDKSRDAAGKALDAARLDGDAALSTQSTVAAVEALFDSIGSGRARALQVITATMPLPDGPALVVVEAPTGEGKTEAALHLAARLQTRRGPDGRGLYVALPTQATGNALLDRVTSFLEKAHAGPLGPHVQLVHGGSLVSEALDALLAPLDEDEDRARRAYAASWFLPAKRGLLAPYGVGTVDQALLGGLLARHFFLRLYGLAGKTIVFDEVHAYDGYVRQTFVALLRWLRALGCDVVVLSATLPLGVRDALLAAWGSPAVAADDRVLYPAVTVAHADAPPDVHPFSSAMETEHPTGDPPGRRVTVSLADADEAAVVAAVAAAVRGGATVGVVVNLVGRAQRIGAALRRAADATAHGAGTLDADVVVFHARFPATDRARLERHVSGATVTPLAPATPGRFGKDRAVFPRPAVLVATQVAEQSLDLDVDVLFSDLAPVDLLLQRAGRLHRHRTLDEARPDSAARPHLVVLVPPLAPGRGLPDTRPVGGQWRADRPESVYLNLPLYRTWQCLHDLVDGDATIVLPRDYRPLVEAVYGADGERAPDGLSAADHQAWTDALQAAGRQAGAEAAEFRAAGLPPPTTAGMRDLWGYDDIAGRTADDGLDGSRRAATRMGGPSVQALCLFETPAGIALDTVGGLLPTTRPLVTSDVRALLGRSVRLSRRQVVEALTDGPPQVPGWDALTRRAPALGFCRPLVFRRTGDRWLAHAGGVAVGLDAVLGLVYSPDPATGLPL